METVFDGFPLNPHLRGSPVSGVPEIAPTVSNSLEGLTGLNIELYPGLRLITAKGNTIESARRKHAGGVWKSMHRLLMAVSPYRGGGADRAPSLAINAVICVQCVCSLQTEPLEFSLGNGHGGVYAEQPSKFQSPLGMADGHHKLHRLDKQGGHSEPAFSAREGRDG